MLAATSPRWNARRSRQLAPASRAPMPMSSASAEATATGAPTLRPARRVVSKASRVTQSTYRARSGSPAPTESAGARTQNAANDFSVRRLDASVPDAVGVHEEPRPVGAAPLVAVTTLRFDIHDVVLLALTGRIVGRESAAEEAPVFGHVVETAPHGAARARLNRVVVVVGAARRTAHVRGVLELDGAALEPGDGGVRGRGDLGGLRLRHQEADDADRFLAALRRKLVRTGPARLVRGGVVLGAPDGLRAALLDLRGEDVADGLRDRGRRARALVRRGEVAVERRHLARDLEQEHQSSHHRVVVERDVVRVLDVRARRVHLRKSAARVWHG